MMSSSWLQRLGHEAVHRAAGGVEKFLDLLDCRRFAPGVTLHELFRLIARYAVNDIALQSGGGKKRVDLGVGIRFVPLPRAG